jgi:hypothetical protein
VRFPDRSDNFVPVMEPILPHYRLATTEDSRTTDSPIVAESAEFLFRLVPRLAACALLRSEERASLISRPLHRSTHRRERRCGTMPRTAEFYLIEQGLYLVAIEITNA